LENERSTSARKTMFVLREQGTDGVKNLCQVE
jgi:hypothetical protein